MIKITSSKLEKNMLIIFSNAQKSNKIKPKWTKNLLHKEHHNNSSCLSSSLFLHSSGRRWAHWTLNNMESSDVHTHSNIWETWIFISTLLWPSSLCVHRRCDVSDELCHTWDNQASRDCDWSKFLWLHNGMEKEKNSSTWIRWDLICTDNFLFFKHFQLYRVIQRNIGMKI